VHRLGSGASAGGGVYRSGSGMSGSAVGVHRQRGTADSGRTTFSDDEDDAPAAEELEVGRLNANSSFF
jgi:hypothetical protein